MRGAAPGASERGGAGAPSANEEDPRSRKRQEAKGAAAPPGAHPLPVAEAPCAGPEPEGARVAVRYRGLGTAAGFTHGLPRSSSV